MTGLTAHLFVEDADRAVEFYGRTLGSIELFRNRLPDGRLLFVELSVGQPGLLLSEPFPALHTLPPCDGAALAPPLHVDVEDPDEVANRMVLLGASLQQQVAEQFWGKRYGVVRDPFGVRWSVSTARGA